MRRILVLGAGHSSPYLIGDLLSRATEGGWIVAVADRDPDLARRRNGSEQPLIDELAAIDLVINGTLQDTDRPLMYLQPGEEERLPAGSMIVDVIRDGVIQNPKILSFQCRAAEYPHGVEGE